MNSSQYRKAEKKEVHTLVILTSFIGVVVLSLMLPSNTSNLLLKIGCLFLFLPSAIQKIVGFSDHSKDVVARMGSPGFTTLGTLMTILCIVAELLMPIGIILGSKTTRLLCAMFLSMFLAIGTALYASNDPTMIFNNLSILCAILYLAHTSNTCV